MEKYTIEKYSNPNNTRRWNLINYIIKQNNFINYLEIGVFEGENIREVAITNKDGVDPGVEGCTAPEVNYRMTSDEFFELIKDRNIKYDVIFIDGLHHSDQVDKDIINSLNYLTPNGFIIIHDCNPPEYDIQLVPRQTVLWTGDVWKSIVKLRYTNPHLEINVVDADWGVGIVRLGNQELYNKVPLEQSLNYDYFNQNREELLNIISVEEFYEKFKNNGNNNFKIYLGNQSDKSFINNILTNLNNDINFVIDDDSRNNDDILNSFKFFLPKMKNGFIYFIENSHNDHTKKDELIANLFLEISKNKIELSDCKFFYEGKLLMFKK